MAEEQIFSKIGGQLVEKIFSSILWFGLALVVVAVVIFVMWYFVYYKRKFDILVKIRSQRADGFSTYFDKAAILYDKKARNKYLRLRDTKVDLPLPNFNLIDKTNWGDYLEIWRKSEEEFIFLMPSEINKTQVLRQDGILYPIAQTEQKQVEGDVSYWNVKRKDKHKSLFDTESMLMKLLPYIPLVVGGAFMIFMLYILLDTLPGLIGELAELAKTLRSSTIAQLTPG